MNSSFLTKPGLRIKVVGRNLQDIIPILNKYPIELVDESPELIISHGGDGSLLGAERDFPGIPKCPIRDTAQNPKCPLHSYRQVLDQLFQGKLKHSRLDILIASTDKDSHVIRGVNDIVLTREIIASAIRYRIRVNGEIFREQVIADSLVISTPFGSTGYFQSITGGNFTSGLGFAYNNAIDGPKFAMIAPPETVEIEILRGPAIAAADNNPVLFHLETGDRLTVYLEQKKTDIFGVDIFRCQNCFLLRRDGIDRRK